MYSLISIRTMLFSSSNSAAARLFASSVLPTPVGPKNRKEPMGLLGSLIPALERMMASVTLVTPSSCPTTRLCSSSSRWRVLLRSLSVSFATGMPVQRDTMLAISASVTFSWIRVRSDSLIFSSSCFNRFSFSGKILFSISLYFAKSWLR